MRWGTLPKAGGMNDQDYKVMSHMSQLARVHDAAHAWHKSPKDMTAEQKKVFAWLHKAGLQ
jgi:hypothetical protein